MADNNENHNQGQVPEGNNNNQHRCAPDANANNNNQQRCAGGNGNNNNNNNNNGKTQNSNFPTMDNDFEGLVPGVQAVMGMFFEKNLKHRKSYTMFKKAILIYAETNKFKHCKYLHRVLSYYVNGADELAKDKPRISNED